MNLQNEDKVDRAVDKLARHGVVPLDQIFGLTESGTDFSTLDEKYNVTN